MRFDNFSYYTTELLNCQQVSEISIRMPRVSRVVSARVYGLARCRARTLRTGSSTAVTIGKGKAYGGRNFRMLSKISLSGDDRAEKTGFGLRRLDLLLGYSSIDVFGQPGRGVGIRNPLTEPPARIWSGCRMCSRPAGLRQGDQDSSDRASGSDLVRVPQVFSASRAEVGGIKTPRTEPPARIWLMCRRCSRPGSHRYKWYRRAPPRSSGRPGSRRPRRPPERGCR